MHTLVLNSGGCRVWNSDFSYPLSPREGDVKSTLYHWNLLTALSKVLAQGQVPAVPAVIMTTLPQGAGHRQNPDAFSHMHTCKLSEHGGVNASGIADWTYRCLISSEPHAECILFLEKLGGKKKKSHGTVYLMLCFWVSLMHNSMLSSLKIKNNPFLLLCWVFSKKFMHTWKQIKTMPSGSEEILGLQFQVVWRQF